MVLEHTCPSFFEHSKHLKQHGRSSKGGLALSSSFDDARIIGKKLKLKEKFRHLSTLLYSLTCPIDYKFPVNTRHMIPFGRTLLHKMLSIQIFIFSTNNLLFNMHNWSFVLKLAKKFRSRATGLVIRRVLWLLLQTLVNLIQKQVLLWFFVE